MTETRNPAVWQVSGGPVDRPYAQVFLDYGVALIGPGHDGPWQPGRADIDAGEFVRRFAEELRTGDLLLLRTAIDQVAAVGLVAGEYGFLEPFDDVNGWDLRHGRRVRWCRLPEPYRFPANVFGANPRRLARVQNQDTLDYARSFLTSGLTRWREAPLPACPRWSRRWKKCRKNCAMWSVWPGTWRGSTAMRSASAMRPTKTK